MIQIFIFYIKSIKNYVHQCSHSANMQNYIFTNILFPVQCIFRTYSFQKEKVRLELVLMSLFPQQKERISHLGSLVIHQFHSISFMHKNFSFTSLFPKYQDSNLHSSLSLKISPFPSPLTSLFKDLSLFLISQISRSPLAPFPSPLYIKIPICPLFYLRLPNIKIPSLLLFHNHKYYPDALSSKSLFKDLIYSSSPFAKYQDSPLALFSITFK